MQMLLWAHSAYDWYLLLPLPLACQLVAVSMQDTGPECAYLFLINLYAHSSHERTPEELELVFEELVHIAALSHLSTSIKRELSSIIVFEAHAQAGTICEYHIKLTISSSIKNSFTLINLQIKQIPWNNYWLTAGQRLNTHDMG